MIQRVFLGEHNVSIQFYYNSLSRSAKFCRIAAQVFGPTERQERSCKPAAQFRRKSASCYQYFSSYEAAGLLPVDRFFAVYALHNLRINHRSLTRETMVTPAWSAAPRAAAKRSSSDTPEADCSVVAIPSLAMHRHVLSGSIDETASTFLRTARMHAAKN